VYSTLNIKSKLLDYDVKFINSFDEINYYTNQNNTITIIDKNVSLLYNFLNKPDNIIIESDEEVKTFTGINYLLDEFTKRKVNIKTKLIVIGGGVLQDLVGFCASIYCRGIEYILVPTTLLAQTDSCVGGKTSINFNNKKNILGTFYPPKEILICSKFLETLSKIDYFSGLGEIFKFHILNGNISNFNYNSNIKDMIYSSLKYKIDILLIDEFDKNERKFLNYGHTFGHALESISEYKIPHGIAVILGSLIATKIAFELNYNVKDYELILKNGFLLLKESTIQLKEEWFDLNKLIELIKSDKKSVGKLTMVLVDSKPFLADIENTKIIKNILKKTYESI
jgi:3-dehydroquinate synthase